MTALALKFVLVWGWRRLVIAVLFGAVAAAAMAPLSMWPALFIALPVLVWLLDGIYAQSETWWQRLWPAFWTGWGFGFGYFGASLYWIGEAFLVDAATFGWVLPFAITLLPAGLALFWGGAAVLAISMWQPGFVRILAFSASFGLLEWLRGTILTGFPWNAPGYAVDGNAALGQLASITGLYGVTFFVILWGAAAAALADDSAHYSQRMTRGAALLLTVISLISALTYGNWRLASAPSEFHQDINLRIVQPNIAQRDKWQINQREAIYARYLELTKTPAGNNSGKSISHVIWPESALPMLISELPEVRKEIGALLPGKPVFIMGAITREPQSTNSAVYTVHNSVITLGSDGQIIAEYHKQKLVPFGEYLPFADWLEPLGLRKLVAMPVGFKPGPGPKTIDLPSTPAFAALVCYEAIFPRQLVDRGARPRWLVNVTNDAWFGRSFGPYQHFAQARMRAIEEGLPLVRAANTGISAVVDPYGRVLHRLGLNLSGTIDSRLPIALSATFYAKHGNHVFFFLIGVAFFTVYGHFLRYVKSQRCRGSTKSAINH